MKQWNRRFQILLLLAGAAAILAGVLLTPDFVARHIRNVDELPGYAVTKVMSYQLYLVIFGICAFLLSLYLYSRRIMAFLFVPLMAALFLLVYRVHIRVLYPDNIIFKRSELSKPLRVLLGKDILLSDFQPRPGLVVRNRQVMKARYPAVDFHFCLKSLKGINADELVKAMDACGIKAVVNIDGQPAHFRKFTKEYKEKYPDRFIMFYAFRYWEVSKPDFREKWLSELDNAVKMGAKGLKVYKNLGIDFKDASGNVVQVDDPRFDPVWTKAGALHLPVLIHSSDPAAFWAPTDRFNERYEELRDYPGWSYSGGRYPSKETILKATENLVRKHPETNFVLAHFGSNPEDLGYVSSLMDKYPNYYVDMAAAIAELGRQPFTARKFFIKYQDRILFATDGGYGLETKGLWTPERYFRTYFEFLETDNEYFEYPLWGIYSQGRWRVYGLDLPATVLEKIYYKNALKLLGLK